nr:reverse transcriptase domain-containing protein [Tanacetum cinerariifolium]
MAMNHLTTFVPEKLDVDAMNYSSWGYYFSHLCHGYGIFDHLVDLVASSSTATPTDPPPKDAEWTKIDFIIRSWIFSTLAPSLRKRLVDLKPTAAKDAWTYIAESIVSVLNGLGSPRSNDDVVTFALEGLPSIYETISTVIVSREPFLDLKTVRSLLTTHEMRLKSRVQNPLVDATSASPMVLLAKSNTSDLKSLLPGRLMAGSVEGGGPKGMYDREETPPPLTKEQIEGHVFPLKSLIKSNNQRNKGDPIRLDFESEDTEVQDLGIAKGKKVMDEDLRKPFKEARRTPLTRRIIEFAGPEYKMPANIKLYDGTTDPKDHLSCFASAANSGEWLMPVWCRMFQQTLNGSARGWFKRLPHDSINEWADLREAFAARYSVRRACFKEPHEITKIVRKANESLTAFKERWTVETSSIMDVPEVMKISSFMDAVKSLELAKRFSNKVPTTGNEMLERLDDFVRSEEAYARTELPRWEVGETDSKTSLVFNRRDIRSSRNVHPGESRRSGYRNNYRGGRDAYLANRTRDDRDSYPPPRGENNHRVAPVLYLEYLIKRPKEILATKTQLHLLAPRPMLNPLRSGNTDRYCDYHQEKRHYTNDCIQLIKQLEMALESGKLNHLVKDVRHKGKGPQGRDDSQPAKVINVISVNTMKDKKRNGIEVTEPWMNILISFPAISSKDVFEEPLIGEAEVEGYLVRRNKGQVEGNPNGFGRVRWRNIETTRKYRARGRPGLKTPRAIPSTIHSMMKFPTPKGVATLVTQTIIIAKCRRLEKKQMVKESSEWERKVAVTEEVLINLSFLDRKVTIDGGLSEACKDQLKHLLKDNIRVYAREPSDMTGVPR